MQPVAESVRHMVEADIADGMGALPGRKFKISESIEHELHWGYRASDRKDGGPGQSRTADLRFRKPLLYPTELRGLLLLTP
jgi:hypothetical protein